MYFYGLRRKKKDSLNFYSIILNWNFKFAIMYRRRGILFEEIEYFFSVNKINAGTVKKIFNL